MNTPPEVSAAYIAATDLQRNLALALGKGLCKRDAMLEAGYTKVQAHKVEKRHIEHPHVVTLSRWYASQAVVKHEATIEQVVKEMGDIALFDPALMYDEDGAMLPVHKWPKEARSSFAGFDSQGAPKFVSKTSAADTLAKIKGWFAPERHIHTVNPLEKLINEVQGNALPVIMNDPERKAE